MEFMIPVQYIGIRHARVQADSLEEAVKKVRSEADFKVRFEMNLSRPHYEVLAPVLMLTEEEKLSWPYWEYGYSGSDGVDWRVHYTKDGLASIPDYAETKNPVPADWLESWKESDVKREG